MKKIIVTFSIAIFCINSAIAETCFIALKDNKILFKQGNHKNRQAACSTFKIALSLMGFNENLLINEKNPEYPYKEEYVDWVPKWKQSHNPRLWLQNSCVWYSRILTKQLGMRKLKEYVKKFNYGNQDVSGDKGKNNGLTNCWLSSSLKISPYEQVLFIQKLTKNTLPVSIKSQKMTKKLLFVEELEKGWKLYAKTGCGSQKKKDGTPNYDLQVGWFVGWIQKGNITIPFACQIVDEKKEEGFASIRAKKLAKEKLNKLSKTI